MTTPSEKLRANVEQFDLIVEELARGQPRGSPVLDPLSRLRGLPALREVLVAVIGPLSSGKSTLVSQLSGVGLPAGVIPTTHLPTVLIPAREPSARVFGASEELLLDGAFEKGLDEITAPRKEAVRVELDFQAGPAFPGIAYVDMPGFGTADSSAHALHPLVARSDIILICWSADRPPSTSEAHQLRILAAERPHLIVLTRADVLNSDDRRRASFYANSTFGVEPFLVGSLADPGASPEGLTQLRTELARLAVERIHAALWLFSTALLCSDDTAGPSVRATRSVAEARQAFQSEVAKGLGELMAEAEDRLMDRLVLIAMNPGTLAGKLAAFAESEEAWVNDRRRELDTRLARRLSDLSLEAGLSTDILGSVLEDMLEAGYAVGGSGAVIQVAATRLRMLARAGTQHGGPSAAGTQLAAAIASREALSERALAGGISLGSRLFPMLEPVFARGWTWMLSKLSQDDEDRKADLAAFARRMRPFLTRLLRIGFEDHEALWREQARIVFAGIERGRAARWRLALPAEVRRALEAIRTSRQEAQ